VLPIQERLGHAADEIVLVGDDPELDIAAGRRAGRHVFGVS
jgi:ribonucleotide monophosphatase NagD (HAD superfamily)